MLGGASEVYMAAHLGPSEQAFPRDRIDGCRKSCVITPGDTFSPPLRGIKAAGAGNLVYVLAGDEDADARTDAIGAGEFIGYLRIRKIIADGTTATGLIGYW